MKRDVIDYDILIVGAGPSGLSASIRLKQLAELAGRDIRVCVLEKSAQVGAHIISGAILDPIALSELLPNWKELGAPINTAVNEDQFIWLNEKKSTRLPKFIFPPLMKNNGNFIVSLSDLCVWMAQKAEDLGVEIYSGFAATQMLYDEQGAIKGICTGDMGRDKSGEPGPQFSLGMEIHAAYTLIAEGTRGSLTRELEEHFALRHESGTQKYGLGLKEVWKISPDKHQAGLVQHTIGWPLNDDAGGGGFIYHYGKDLLSIGFVVHLDYSNPYLSPFEEFQRFKSHPSIRSILDGGRRMTYGARAINEGGLQSWPKMIFPGGILMGCSAGMVNLPRIKGISNAMKSGMLAAEAAFSAWDAGRSHDLLDAYPRVLRQSWIWSDLYAVRNVKPWLSNLGNKIGLLIGGFEMWLSSTGINIPWTLKHKKADHECLNTSAISSQIVYPKPDGKVSFDRLSSVALSNIAHEHNQPCHLHLIRPELVINYNLPMFAAPEQRYCPAGVYEILHEEGNDRLQINAQNCIHCKACDIKDPKQNIVWVTPEGGSGPMYNGM